MTAASLLEATSRPLLATLTFAQDVDAPGLWQRLWMGKNAGSALGDDTDAMYIWLWWFCVFWFVFLMALMVYFVAKYRRRPGVPAIVSPAHNTPLEIAWTVIPTLFLVYIFFRGFQGYMDKLVSPGDAVEMRLTAYKWNWELEYPNGGNSPATAVIGARSVPVFYLPAGVNIRLRMNSRDVMHAFWVPAFRIKQDIVPNRYTALWFNANDPSGDKTHPLDANAATARRLLDASAPDFIEEFKGVPYEDHWVFCAEYCGDEHSEMAAILRIVPEDAFNRWLPTTAEDPNASPADVGRAVYTVKGCASCHSLDGSPNTGPTWKDVYGHEVELADGSRVPGDANYIRESILIPGAKIVKGYGNNMPPFVLSERQIDGVIAYMRTISVHAGGNAAPPATAPTDPAAPPGTPAPAPN